MARQGRHEDCDTPGVRLALTDALREIAVLMVAKMQEEALTGSALLRQEGFRDGVVIVRQCLSEDELGIALEHLCYLVEEARLPISSKTYHTLAAAGSALQMHPGYWSELRPDAAIATV